MMKTRISIVLAGVTLAAATTLAAQANPQRAAAELIAADRAFAAAAAQTDLVAALTAMFADDVILPAPGVGFAEGRAAAMNALRRDTLNATSRAHWMPVRAAVSGDGTHGYTLGFFETTRANGTKVPGKYLAYWIRGANGWRVAVYRRTARPPGSIDTTELAPVLPPRTIDPSMANIADARASLAQAETDFSNAATQIGIGPAFERFGDAEAMHINGGPTIAGFVRGNVAIGQSVGAGYPGSGSPVVWGADFRTIVSASGDFGVNVGYIRAKEAGPGGQQSPPFPFFTIWRRADARSPWRYIAE